jgi:hypothetical protein
MPQLGAPRRAWCLRVEDMHTLVLHPEGGGALRLRLPAPLPDARLLRAAPQTPVAVTLSVGPWDHATGLFHGTVLCE